MNYLTENNQLIKAFNNISNHLDFNGLFVFDFWYGPAVLTDRPVVRIKRMENDTTKVFRTAEPKLHSNKNIVDVSFELHITDKKTEVTNILNETHRMRYFFLPEIELLAKQSGFEIVKTTEWMKDAELSFNSWYGLVILRKVK